MVESCIQGNKAMRNSVGIRRFQWWCESCKMTGLRLRIGISILQSDTVGIVMSHCLSFLTLFTVSTVTNHVLSCHFVQIDAVVFRQLSIYEWKFKREWIFCSTVQWKAFFYHVNAEEDEEKHTWLKPGHVLLNGFSSAFHTRKSISPPLPVPFPPTPDSSPPSQFFPPCIFSHFSFIFYFMKSNVFLSEESHLPVSPRGECGLKRRIKTSKRNHYSCIRYSRPRSKSLLCPFLLHIMFSSSSSSWYLEIMFFCLLSVTIIVLSILKASLFNPEVYDTYYSWCYHLVSWPLKCWYKHWLTCDGCFYVMSWLLWCHWWLICWLWFFQVSESHYLS